MVVIPEGRSPLLERVEVVLAPPVEAPPGLVVERPVVVAVVGVRGVLL
jgi:hypothetical protein